MMLAKFVKEAVRKHFAGSGAVVMEEVGNGTGWVQTQRRWADMLIMETWPSRGLEVIGVEVKVSRQDWLAELANPAKAEEMAQHCDRWFLAVGPGVLKDLNEVPAPWGVMEVAGGDSGDLVLTVSRKAEQKARGDSLPKLLVAAMLRAQDRAFEKDVADAVRAEVHRRITSLREQDRQWAQQGHQRFAALAAAVKAELGEDANWIGDDELARAMAVVIRLGLTKGYGGLGTLFQALVTAEEAAKKVRTAFEKNADVAAAINLAMHKTLGKRDAKW